MRTISTKEEKQSKLDKKENSQKKPTPWQEAHQKYLQEKTLMDKILKKNQEQEESESLAEPSEEVEQQENQEQEKNERPMIEMNNFHIDCFNPRRYFLNFLNRALT